MVHALEEIHRLLRPNGTLIDIHPYASPSIVQVVQNGEILFAEPKRDISDEHEGVLAAEDALSEVVEREVFLVERAEEFDFYSYGPTVLSLRQFWDEYNEYEDEPQTDDRLAQEEVVYSKAEALREERNAEAAIHERTKIARLKPIWRNE